MALMIRGFWLSCSALPTGFQPQGATGSSAVGGPSGLGLSRVRLKGLPAVRGRRRIGAPCQASLVVSGRSFSRRISGMQMD